MIAVESPIKFVKQHPARARGTMHALKMLSVSHPDGFTARDLADVMGTDTLTAANLLRLLYLNVKVDVTRDHLWVVEGGVR